jgi:ribonuclease Y
MSQFIPLAVGIIALGIGSVLGYYARQSIAKKKLGTVDQKLQALINQAKDKAAAILEAAKREEDHSRKRLFKTEQLLLKRENILDQKLSDYERRERDFQQKVEKLRELKESLEGLKKEALDRLERIAKFSKTEAKKELLAKCEEEFGQEILEKMRKLEKEGRERLELRAKEILALAIQKCALSQAQEITTSTVFLPSEDIKGRIIGKEGRNIKTLEKLTGVEIVVDETPEAVVISGFDPIRRQIAKTSLEKLIQDGRIQPARIEEIVQKTESEISSQIKEAGEAAVYDTGVIGLDQRLVQLLGRLKFRTSYGQNVLLHSIEVAHLAGALSQELGANSRVAKKAGLLHDIGKAMDHQVEGSHVDIGIRILEKFGVEKEVIQAMKSHHEEYPAESIEAILVFKPLTRFPVPGREREKIL